MAARTWTLICAEVLFAAAHFTVNPLYGPACVDETLLATAI